MNDEKVPSTRPPSKRQKTVAFALALLAVALMGARQYSKYVNGHGFFSLFDQGDVILAACVAAAVCLILVLALKDK